MNPTQTNKQTRNYSVWIFFLYARDAGQPQRSNHNELATTQTRTQTCTRERRCVASAAWPFQAPDRPQSPCCCPVKGSHACRGATRTLSACDIRRTDHLDGDHRVQTRSAFVFSYTHCAPAPCLSPTTCRPSALAQPCRSRPVPESLVALSLKSPESLSMHAQPCMLHPCASRNHHPGLRMHASASRHVHKHAQFDQEVVCGVSVCERSRLVPLIHHQPLALQGPTSPFESPFFASNLVVLEQRVLSTNLYERCDTSSQVVHFCLLSSCPSHTSRSPGRAVHPAPC